MKRYTYVILGLTLSSATDEAHAPTYRGLVKRLAARGHRVLFLERGPGGARGELPEAERARALLYESLDDLAARFAGDVERADLVIVGSRVPEGALVGGWALATARGKVAFYDLDPEGTLAELERGERAYLTPELVPRYDLYLSFTGGPTLGVLEGRWRARRARALHGSVDPEEIGPGTPSTPLRDLGYLGAYSAARRPALERLLLEPARRWPEGRFAVAGARYPEALASPGNVERAGPSPPGERRAFHRASRFALILEREPVLAAGFSPSAALFEAAACEVPVITEPWAGLARFFEPGSEILVARSAEDVQRLLRDVPEAERQAIARRARWRTLAMHTADHRAAELEEYTRELVEGVG